MKNNWQTKTLGEVCEIYQPKTISAKEMSVDGKFPVFGANGIIGKYKAFNHEEPQLLMTCRGATCGSINVSLPRSWITGNAMVIRPRNGNLDLRFLEYLLRGPIDLSQAITGSAQPQITRTNLSPLEISFPESLPEQRRIVAILDDVFERAAKAKANAGKNLANTRELFESYLQKVFAEPGADWEIATIEESFKIRSGDFLPSKNMKDDGQFEVYGGNGVAGMYDQCNLQGENIIVGRVGAKCGNVRHVKEPIWLTDNAFSISTFLKPFDLSYLTYLLNYKNLRAQANQTAQPVISYQTIKPVVLPVPPIQKQRIIAANLDALSSETKQLEAIYRQKLSSLEELKKSVLHSAFRGEL